MFNSDYVNYLPLFFRVIDFPSHIFTECDTATKAHSLTNVSSISFIKPAQAKAVISLLILCSLREGVEKVKLYDFVSASLLSYTSWTCQMCCLLGYEYDLCHQWQGAKPPEVLLFCQYHRRKPTSLFLPLSKVNS